MGTFCSRSLTVQNLYCLFFSSIIMLLHRQKIIFLEIEMANNRKLVFLTGLQYFDENQDQDN